MAEVAKPAPAVPSSVATASAESSSELKSPETRSENVSSKDTTHPSANAATQIVVSDAPQLGAAAVADASQPVLQNAEVRATRAMYMAHAPLRSAELADPDSESNRKVLQAMIEKALIRRNSVP